jgi:type IV secretory pathway protease TraF
MKRIAALPGQQVCRRDRTITIDGAVMGEALARDRRGRDLPSWQGCHVIAASEIFVMNEQVQDSLDGRYFGSLSTRSIVGRALALWTDAEGDGRYQWRAPSP